MFRIIRGKNGTCSSHSKYTFSVCVYGAECILHMHTIHILCTIHIFQVNLTKYGANTFFNILTKILQIFMVMPPYSLSLSRNAFHHNSSPLFFYVLYVWRCLHTASCISRADDTDSVCQNADIYGFKWIPLTVKFAGIGILSPLRCRNERKLRKKQIWLFQISTSTLPQTW